MLEKHGLLVDTVKSANAALDFLASHRPDAIFMDHMMPGMDGFQAVKAIKANPQTATIPVMMYTSKGGDLYIGQARALGAVGVLPKTVAPAELFESLRKIGLVKDRRSEERTPDEEVASERAEDIDTHSAAPVAPFIEPGMQTGSDKLTPGQLDQQLRYLLEEQRVEIRKDVLLSMETVARQTNGKLHKELDEKIDQLENIRRKSPIPLLIPTVGFALLLAASLLLNLLMYFDHQAIGQAANRASSHALAGQALAQADTIAELETQRVEAVAALQNSWSTAAWAMNQSLVYPYDEIALDNLRVDKIETLLSKLLESGFEGRLVIETHAGEFCLLGNEEDGFSLPAPDLPVDQCEFIGNPVQATDVPSAHQSLRFANFVASTPLLSDDRIQLDIVTLPRSEALAPYPEKSAESKAEVWNQAAHLNNRVNIRLETK
jgi:CheY-like chemotaxis protein